MTVPELRIGNRNGSTVTAKWELQLLTWKRWVLSSESLGDRWDNVASKRTACVAHETSCPPRWKANPSWSKNHITSISELVRKESNLLTHYSKRRSKATVAKSQSCPPKPVRNRVKLAMLSAKPSLTNRNSLSHRRPLQQQWASVLRSILTEKLEP